MFWNFTLLLKPFASEEVESPPPAFARNCHSIAEIECTVSSIHWPICYWFPHTQHWTVRQYTCGVACTVIGVRVCVCWLVTWLKGTTPGIGTGAISGKVFTSPWKIGNKSEYVQSFAFIQQTNTIGQIQRSSVSKVEEQSPWTKKHWASKETASRKRVKPLIPLFQFYLLSS